jgi:hypothetical protein
MESRNIRSVRVMTGTCWGKVQRGMAYGFRAVRDGQWRNRKLGFIFWIQTVLCTYTICIMSVHNCNHCTPSKPNFHMLMEVMPIKYLLSRSWNKYIKYLFLTKRIVYFLNTMQCYSILRCILLVLKYRNIKEIMGTCCWKKVFCWLKGDPPPAIAWKRSCRMLMFLSSKAFVGSQHRETKTM